VRRPLASLDQFIAVDRNRVVERVATSLAEALQVFESHGLEPLRREWEAMDAHAGARLRVRLANGRVLTGYTKHFTGVLDVLAVNFAVTALIPLHLADVHGHLEHSLYKRF